MTETTEELKHPTPIEYLGKILLSEESPFIEACEGLDDTKIAELVASAALVCTLFLSQEISAAASIVRQDAIRTKNPMKASTGREVADVLDSIAAAFIPNLTTGEPNA